MSKCGRKSCCCKCQYQIKLHACDCGKCAATVGGYVCLSLGDKDGVPTGIYMGFIHHSECEEFTLRHVSK